MPLFAGTTVISSQITQHFVGFFYTKRTHFRHVVTCNCVASPTPLVDIGPLTARPLPTPFGEWPTQPETGLNLKPFPVAVGEIYTQTPPQPVNH